MTTLRRSHWHFPYIMAAYRLGMVQGKTEKEFCPDEQITREEAAAVVFRTLTAAGVSLEGAAGNFTDESEISAFAKEAAAALAVNGVIAGMEDGSFRPADYLTRAQAAALLSRFYHLLP